MGGFATVVPTVWIPTFSLYADVDIPASGSYTPASGGLFFNAGDSDWGGNNYFYFGIYSPNKATWYERNGSSYFNPMIIMMGDGANFRIRNNSTTYAYRLLLMRMG
jgi:hypothetical protein